MAQDLTTLTVQMKEEGSATVAQGIQKVGDAAEQTAASTAKLGESSDFAAKRAAILARHADEGAAATARAGEATEKHKAYLARATEALNKAGESTGSLTGAMTVATTIGTVLGGVILRVGEALLGWVGDAMKAAGATHEMSQRIGVAASDLAGLQLAFKTSGVEAGGMQMAMSQLQRSAYTNSEAFQKLGIDAKNSNGEWKTSKELLYEVAQRFEGTKDSAEKSAIALQLFGRSGAQLLPILNDGATGLRDMAELAENLGLVIDSKTAAAGDRLGDALDVIGAALQAVTTRAVSGVLPALADLADQFMRSEQLAGALTFASEMLGAAFDLLVLAGEGIITTFNVVGKTLGGLWASLNAFMQGNLSQAGQILKEMGADVEATLLRAAGRVSSVLDGAAIGAEKAAGGTLKLKAATTEAEKANAKWITTMADQVTMNGALVAAGGKLTQSQRMQLELDKKLTDSSSGITEAQASQAQAHIRATAATEKQLDSLKKNEAAQKSGASASKAHAKEQATLTTQIDNYIYKARNSLAATDAMRDHTFSATSYTDQLSKALAGMAGELQKTEKLNQQAGATRRASLQSLAEEKAAREVAIAVMKEEAKWKEEVDKWTRKYTEAQERETATVQAALVKDIEVNETLRRQAEQIGMTSAQLRESEKAHGLRQDAVMRATATDLEWEAANQGGNKTLEEQARLLRERAAQAESGVLLKEAIDVGKEWAKITDEIGKGLTDSLFRAFESGKNFFTTLWDGIKNVFKTTVLKMLIQPVQGAITSMVGSVLGGAGSANAAGSMSNAGGMLSGIGSLTSGVGALGAFGLGAQSGFGALMSGAGLEGITGGLAALTSGGAGSIAAGLGSIVGVLGPIALGIGAIYSLWKSMDDSGTYHTGGSAFADASSSGVTQRGQSISWDLGGYTSKGAQDATLALSQSVAGILNVLGGVGGSGGNFRVETGFADDTSGDGAWGALAIQRDGQKVLDWRDTQTSRWAAKEFSDGDAGYKEYLAAITESTRTAIMSIGLPEWAQKVVASLGGAPTLEQLAAAAQQIATTQGVLVAFSTSMAPLEGVFARVAVLGADATLQLAGFAGGMDALIAKTRSFVETYYTEAEKAGIQAKSIMDALQSVGLSTDVSTKGEFRAMVDSLDVSTEIGRKQLATLLDIAPSFASLADYLMNLEAKNAAAGETSVAIADSLTALAASAPGTPMADALAAKDAEQAAVMADGQTVSNDLLRDLLSQAVEQTTALARVVAAIVKGSEDVKVSVDSTGAQEANATASSNILLSQINSTLAEMGASSALNAAAPSYTYDPGG